MGAEIIVGKFRRRRLTQAEINQKVIEETEKSIAAELATLTKETDPDGSLRAMLEAHVPRVKRILAERN